MSLLAKIGDGRWLYLVVDPVADPGVDTNKGTLTGYCMAISVCLIDQIVNTFAP